LAAASQEMFTTGLTMVENRALGPLASSFVFDKFISGLSKKTQVAPETSFASKAPASSNLLEMFSSMFSGAVSWSKVMMKAVKKLAIKILKEETARAASTGIMTVAYELKGDIRRGVFDAMRFTCDGFAHLENQQSKKSQIFQGLTCSSICT
jgi:hypothetical protein